MTIFVNPPVLQSSSKQPYRVFILHSYEQGHVCGQPQHDGVVAALHKNGFKEDVNLQVGTFYMDTKRRYNTPELITEQADRALEMVHAFAPHVLVTLDDNAFRTVALRLVDSSISVVFCGLNNQPEAYSREKMFMQSRTRPGHNITGVYEKLHIADACQVHSKLFPGLKKILILIDSSPTGKAIEKQIDIELSAKDLSCGWQLKMTGSWDDYRSAIESANQDPLVGAIYPAALLLKDQYGKSFTAPEIFDWTVRHSRKPEIALNYAFTRMGLFGGAAVDFYAMGLQAGEMAARCLRGEKPASISIEEASKYALVFNLDRARQLGIEIPSDIIMAADEVISTTP